MVVSGTHREATGAAGAAMVVEKPDSKTGNGTMNNDSVRGSK